MPKKEAYSSKYIVVYYDKGTSEKSRNRLTKSLRKNCSKDVKVRQIYANEIVNSDAWHKDTLLFAMPGGADLPYCKKLNGKGNASIRKFVETGGTYLGICAGAYYGAQSIRFNPDTKDAIIEERELSFFQGCASGSIYELAEPYKKHCLKCAKVVKIALKQYEQCDNSEIYHILYWGGPKFEANNNEGDFEVIARYLDLPRPNNIAVTKIRVGKGIAILCGLHPEYTGYEFRKDLKDYDDGDDEKYKKQASLLIENDSKRCQFFRILLKHAELEHILI